MVGYSPKVEDVQYQASLMGSCEAVSVDIAVVGQSHTHSL